MQLIMLYRRAQLILRALNVCHVVAVLDQAFLDAVRDVGFGVGVDVLCRHAYSNASHVVDNAVWHLEPQKVFFDERVHHAPGVAYWEFDQELL